MVKFLVIRFSSIGDIVLTTPVVRGLKNQVSRSEIHYLTKPDFAPLLQANPNISRVHTLAEQPGETIAALRKEGFDYVIDLQNNLRSMYIKRSLKRMYFTVNKLNILKWLLVNFKINRLPDKHIVDRYFETTSLFDVKNDGEGLDYFIPKEEEVGITNLPEPFHKGFIALVIGANHQTKKLPVDHLAELAGKLKNPVIIIGGPGDKEDAETIVDSLEGKKILNGCGKWSVNQSASVIRQANCVITHDTGMMHISAAFKKKIITVWGNTIPDFGMYPYQPDPRSVNFEVSGLTCRPCSKLGKSKCPKKHFRCMLDHDMQNIAETANKIYEPTEPQTGK
ncbi:MAG: glycosyltransferase family 9 protein [Bacteroidales bacterium]